MLTAALAFLAGLLAGSFLNVCIHRMPRDISIVRPRSHCPECRTPVAWYDNLPVASYLLLGGRCRHCRRPIPIRYPVVEALTGALFFIIVLPLGASLAALKLCLFSALLIGLIFSDLERRILPDEFTLGGAAAGLALAAVAPMEVAYAPFLLPAQWSERWVSVSEAVLGAVFVSGLLWMVGAAYGKIRHKEVLGFGDVKMMAMVGSFLGLAGAFHTLVLGSIAGSVVGLAYIKLTGKDASTYELPFGSFLGAAALLVGLAHSPVPAFYLKLAG